MVSLLSGLLKPEKAWVIEWWRCLTGKTFWKITFGIILRESILIGMFTNWTSQQTAYYLTFVAQNWLSIRLEFAGTMIVMCACLVAVMGHNQLGGNEHFAGESISCFVLFGKLCTVLNHQCTINCHGCCSLRACGPLHFVCTFNHEHFELDSQNGEWHGGEFRGRGKDTAIFQYPRGGAAIDPIRWNSRVELAGGGTYRVHQR